MSTPTGWYTNTAGYRVGTLTKSNHMKYEHIDIVEKVIGRPLPEGAEVHHWDENTSNNSHRNLVVCPSRAYHKLLHVRMRAKKACGNPDWRACVFCKEYDNPEQMVKHSDTKKGRTQQRYCHQKCRSDYAKRLRSKKAK